MGQLIALMGVLDIEVKKKMYEKKTITKTIELHEDQVTISKNLFNLFKEWIKETKLSNQKLKLLQILRRENKPVFLEDLHKETSLSLPLISYHINGNLKSVGLIEAELVEKDFTKARAHIKLTKFGETMVDLLEDKNENGPRYKYQKEKRD